MSNLVDIELMVEAEIAAVADPLLCNVEMPLCGTYYPLGFAVEITTNSPYILEAARESWGEFRTATSSQPALQLRIGVTETESNMCPPAPVVRTQRNLLSMVADADNFATCDLEQRFAFMWLTQSAVEHRSYVRYHFLEAVVFVLLASSHATPIHAACVSYEGHGFLLCGDSGAGKSSLAYACARAGWTYTADDSIYLLGDRDESIVVGNPYKIRFRPSAARLFPELAGQVITPRAAGKPSIELSTNQMGGIEIATRCFVEHFVFLNRQKLDRTSMESLSEKAAKQWLSPTPYGTPQAREKQAQSLLKLLQVNLWELRYSDLNSAVELLQSIACRS